MKKNKEKEKLKESKVSAVNIILTIIKVICIILLLMLIVVIGLQRFSNNNIALGGYRIFNVVTESMVPKYVVGDILVVKEKDKELLKEGDDVAYLGKEGSFAGKVVTHQIINIEQTDEGKIYHTKGIANEVEDPTITGDQIYGTVIYKSIIMSKISQLMNNLYAFYFVIFVPLTILIFIEIKDIVDERKEKELEKQETEKKKNLM